MKRKLEPTFTHKTISDNGVYKTFELVKNERYIDLENLEKYTVRDLKSICESYGRFLMRGKKSDYIRIIKNDTKMVNSIKVENRQVKLNNLGI